MQASESRALLAVAEAAADAAAAVIRARAADVSRLTWHQKRRADFVSIVDTEAEQRIAAVVRARVPDAMLIGEELSPDAVPRGITFIADPLDGTTNFLHGYPAYAVSIGVLCDGVPVAGVVLDVTRGWRYTATAGGGAWRDGERLSVSSVVDPGLALVGTGFPFKFPEMIDGYLRHFATVLRSTAGVRRAGSAALDLADVASGRFDAFWELMLAPWDIAAGLLLVREAGGVVTDLDGRDAPLAHTPLVAGNPRMHAWLLETIRHSALGA